MRNHKDCCKELVQICLIAVLILLIVSPGLSVAASEEENIDSFNVHPANRWTVGDSSADIDTVEIAEGCLHVTDIGDGSEDVYRIYRELSKLDAKVEFKVRFITDTTDNNYRDRIAFSLYSSAVGTDSIDFYVAYLGASTGKSSVYVRIKGESGDQNLYFTEDFLNNTWYKVVIDYDILRSEYSIKTYSTAGTKLEEYDESDFTVRPKLFGLEDIKLGLYFGSYTNAKTDDFYVDYIKAPFKEKEWTQIDTPTDSTWLADSWDGAWTEDNVGDISAYQLCVPYFDSCGGKMSVQCSAASLTGSEYASMEFILYGVDGDDGGYHIITAIVIKIYYVGAHRAGWLVWNGSSSTIFSDYEDSAEGRRVVCEFSMGMSDDRSTVSINMQFAYGIDEDTEVTDEYFAVPVATHVTDPSNEFLLQIVYLMDYDGDCEVKAQMTDFALKERSILTGIVEAAGNFIAWLINSILIIGFRFLAGIFKIIGAGLEVAIEALEPLLSAITTAIALIQGWLTTLGDTITGVIEDIQQWIQDVIAPMITALLAAVGTFVGNAITFLLTIIADLAELLIDVVFWIYDSGCVALGLDPPPDLLALIAVAGTGFIQLVQASLNFYMHLPALLINFIRLYIIAFMLALLICVISNPNVAGCIQSWASLFMFDLTMGLSMVGVRIPIPAGGLFLVFLFADALSNSVFAGFLP